MVLQVGLLLYRAAIAFLSSIEVTTTSGGSPRVVMDATRPATIAQLKTHLLALPRWIPELATRASAGQIVIKPRAAGIAMLLMMGLALRRAQLLTGHSTAVITWGYVKRYALQIENTGAASAAAQAAEESHRCAAAVDLRVAAAAASAAARAFQLVTGARGAPPCLAAPPPPTPSDAGRWPAAPLAPALACAAIAGPCAPWPQAPPARLLPGGGMASEPPPASGLALPPTCRLALAPILWR